ncbi:MAG: FAD-dependent oxidoreductase [Candidatus Nitrosocosmicus sp.]|nr:FAD-dependent oxidoreductase [Candidatus Nitrosocosmicus sp.]
MVKKVIIVGAGISGLSIGSLLSGAGVKVIIYEKMDRVGGRTASSLFRNHILDNGFHIMPFYKKSFIFEILKKLEIESRIQIAKVTDIEFYSEETSFHKYPKGILDILSLSMIDFKSRLNLLKVLFPISFYSIKKSEMMDSLPLTTVTKRLDKKTKSFFDAICMLAFADIPENISLGEFIRTIIRANPFRGGTSEFGYPQEGGYDQISKLLANYITSNGSTIVLNSEVKKIIVKNGKVDGVITNNNKLIKTDVCIISVPAYNAINTFFDKGVFDKEYVELANRLNNTTSVVEVHFALSEKISDRQVVFPVGDKFTAKGIFFISNITNTVSPPKEHLMLAGTPVTSDVASNSKSIKSIVKKIKDDIREIYPIFDKVLLWERPMAWKLVESVVKGPGLVWKQKMPHTVSDIEGLFFVGDSTISYGIGTDSAAHSALLCYPQIMSFLKR